MNSQSMGALLILVGCGMLWAIWAKSSPFRLPEKPTFAGPPDASGGSSGSGNQPGGGSGFE